MAYSEARRIIRRQIDRILRDHQPVLGREPGDDWVAPECVEEAYPLDWEARHGDEVWVSLSRMNMSEPGEGEEWDSVTSPRGYEQEEDEPVGMEIIMPPRPPLDPGEVEDE